MDSVRGEGDETNRAKSEPLYPLAVGEGIRMQLLGRRATFHLP